MDASRERMSDPWWKCCCQNLNNPDLTSLYCSSCNHMKCSTCSPSEFKRSSSPGTDSDVPAQNTTPEPESEPRNEHQVEIQTDPLEGLEGKDLKDAHSESGSSEDSFSDQSQSGRRPAMSADMTTAATTELVQLLLVDHLIVSCVKEASRGKFIFQKKFQTQLCRLLRRWARELKLESEPELYEKYVASILIERFSRNISYQLYASITGRGGENSHSSTIPAKTHHRVVLERYLSHGRERYQQSKRPSRDPSGGPDDDSQFDTDGEVDRRWTFSMLYPFPNVIRLRQFLVESKPYQSLRENIFYLVCPNLHRILKKQMTSLSQSHNLPLKDIPQCQTVISETQYASPHTMYLTDQEMEGWVNSCQGLIEKWTRMKWGWWPLRPYRRTLAPGEQRLVWTCVG